MDGSYSLPHEGVATNAVKDILATLELLQKAVSTILIVTSYFLMQEWQAQKYIYVCVKLLCEV